MLLLLLSLLLLLCVVAFYSSFVYSTGGTRRRTVGQTRLAGTKNSSYVGVPLKGAPQAPGDKSSPSEEDWGLGGRPFIARGTHSQYKAGIRFDNASNMPFLIYT